MLDFALQVAFGAEHGALDAAARLIRSDGRLARLRILVAERGDREQALRLGLAVTAARPIVERLMGGDYHYKPTHPAYVAPPAAPVILSQDAEQALKSALRRSARAGPLRIWLVGPAGSGRPGRRSPKPTGASTGLLASGPERPCLSRRQVSVQTSWSSNTRLALLGIPALARRTSSLVSGVSGVDRSWANCRNTC